MSMLTPGKVLDELGGLDCRIANEWQLHDVRWAHMRPRIDVEVTRDTQRLICTIEASPSAQHGLQFGYTRRGTTWNAPDKDLHTVSMEVLAPLSNQATRHNLAANDGKMAPQIEAQAAPWNPRQWEEDSEGWSLLKRLCTDYEAYFKIRVKPVESFNGRRSMHFPIDSVMPPEIFARYQVPGQFVRHRTLRHYFAGLGFGIDERNEMSIVPVPTSLRAGILQVTPDWPFEMRLGQERKMLRAADWSRRWLSFRLPMMVIKAAGGAAGAYVHDVGLHGVLFHRIPSARWHTLLGILNDGVASKPRKVLPRVAEFLEVTLTHTCEDCWGEAFEPQDFDSAFDERFEELMSTAREITRL
jgi:hypothetical protein